MTQIFQGMTPDVVENYSKYWHSLAPKNDIEILQRWIFAYLSIHTSWTANVRGYNAIKDISKWEDCKENLLELLTESRCGMQNKRTEYIWHFLQVFKSNPQFFQKKETESWSEMRSRLMKICKGIGIAKVSFTLEMCHPLDAELTCLDTHMLKLYNQVPSKFTDAKGYKQYEQLERKWLDSCVQNNIAPYIARSIYWDQIQKQPNSRYWSHVLEQANCAI